MSYLLSVIIPTKNRQYYCINSIRQILSFGWDNVEICIQDNSDDNSLENDIISLGVDNVVYHYHPGILSFVDNFNEAVSLAHGDYLCMIGDDDGVLPDILSLVEEMIIQGADAAIPALNFIYFWPSNQKIVENGERGALVSHLHKEYKNHKTKCVDNNRALKELLKNGVQNYTILDMPRLYHGIVQRKALDRIKEMVGYYFGGLTPDMYMATALSIVCNKVIRSNYSVTISGICPTSGSSDSATGKHTGELSQAPHFRGHDNYAWDNLVPSFYSVDTIWADTLFHALRDFKRDDLLSLFNLSLFSGICMNKYPEYRTLILTHALKRGSTVGAIQLALFLNRFYIFKGRIEGIIKKIFSKGLGSNTTRVVDISDIFSAEKKIDEYKRGVEQF